MTREEQGQALKKLFGGEGVCFGVRSFSIESPRASININTLLQACVILECKPDELFFNADIEGASGCDTCGSDGYSVLEIEVRQTKETSE